MMKLAKQYGITVHFVDTSDLENVRTILIHHGNLVRCLYVESIENPTLKVNDIAALSTLTEPLGIPLIVDNTFATPFNTQPFRYVT